MKQLLLLLLAFVSAQTTHAQTALDFQYGSSKADYNSWTLRGSTDFKSRWRFGIEAQASDYRHRFIDARLVSDGFAAQFRLLASACIADNGRLRLDAFFKPGLRFIQASDEPQAIENYTFKNSFAITFEPGLLVTWRPHNRFAFHSGLNMRTVLQRRPEPILEQMPSGLILFGGSFGLAERWTVFATGHAGSMSGAGGDTEKFGWEGSLGLRFALKTNEKRDDLLIIGY